MKIPLCQWVQEGGSVQHCYNHAPQLLSWQPLNLLMVREAYDRSSIKSSSPKRLEAELPSGPKERLVLPNTSPSMSGRPDPSPPTPAPAPTAGSRNVPIELCWTPDPCLLWLASTLQPVNRSQLLLLDKCVASCYSAAESQRSEGKLLNRS